MQKLSISFTLGKASVPKQANLAHNNREYIASNVDKNKVQNNVKYKQEFIEDAYEKLFGKAVAEYNARQKRSDRKIENYYAHISSGKREEAFYEAIIQYGDIKTAPCGSQTGELCKKMLDEYMREFTERNPNLYVFNAVMHMDEATPHIHLDFIPFYTAERKNGLSKGVSMKSALIEQGFDPKGMKRNQLVEWEESERAAMERILNAHGISRDDKNATYAHKTVEQYKEEKDEEQMIAALRKHKNISPENLHKEKTRQLQNEVRSLKREVGKLETEKLSPYKSFFFSDPDKQSFVQAKLDEMSIPYRETDNGFEAQECFVEQIRLTEKQYKPQKVSARTKLRDDIDRFAMQCKDTTELLARLEQEHYTVKQGKYISVKPQGAGQFIRLKSLGENYSEYALRNRINARKRYEGNLQNRLVNAKKDTAEYMVIRTMQFYIIAFQRNALPMKKRDMNKPFSWTNDKELDKLTALNARINSGATLESVRSEFREKESIAAVKQDVLEKSKKDLVSYRELKEKLQIIYEDKPSTKYSREQALQAVKKYPSINKDNYTRVDNLIEKEKEKTAKAEQELAKARAELSAAADIYTSMEKLMGGTYIQALVGEEREKRESDIIPNGLRNA